MSKIKLTHLMHVVIPACICLTPSHFITGYMEKHENRKDLILISKDWSGHQGGYIVCVYFKRFYLLCYFISWINKAGSFLKRLYWCPQCASVAVDLAVHRFSGMHRSIFPSTSQTYLSSFKKIRLDEAHGSKM
jgi:hypothetical protein